MTTTALAQLQVGLNADLVVEHDGNDRSYDVYVPASYSSETAAPLVVDLHGLFDDSATQRNRSGFDALANTQGFLVAYPNGRGNQWADGVLVNSPTDDVGFIRAMVTSIQQNANVETHRIYATGFSNGGAMTQRLACEAADLFAAFASFASSVPEVWTLDDCAAFRPFSIMTTRGNTDQVVPFGGGMVLQLGRVISAAGAFAFWRDVNQCSGDTPDEMFTLGSTTSCESYLNCAAQTEVSFCTVQSNDADGHNVYDNVDNIDLASTAWEFMSQFQLPEASPGFAINFGLTGGWFHPETAGQGLLLEVLPDSQQIFVTWFTYAGSEEKIGSSDHRWLSGLGAIDGNRVEIDLRVTSGGFFDDPTDVVRTQAGSYGTLTLEFLDCSNATMDYQFVDESQSGTRQLIRLGAPPQVCLNALTGETRN